MPDVYFENIHTKNRYKVVSMDKEAGTITLTGRHNAPFVVDYSKEKFEEMGYRPVQAEAEAEASSPAQPAPPPPPPPPAAVAPPPPPPVSQPATA